MRLENLRSVRAYIGARVSADVMRREPSQSCRVHVQLSICHSWTGNTNSSCFFVINLSLSLSQSRKHTWANKIGLHSVPEKQPSLLMLHTNTACLFYLCVNPSSV